VQTPRSAIVRRAGATTGLDDELRRVQAILKDDLDNLIVQFEEENGAFVRDYFNSRKIIDRGAGGKSNGGDGNGPTPTGP